MSRKSVLLCWLLFVLLAVSLQWSRGALDGSWNNDPDEPSHFLNGLMVRDYLISGAGEHPLPYAERYYQHYPRIALGHWPPLFATVEATWFQVAPISYPSALVLLALLAATIATLVAWLCTKWFPFPLAFGAGLGWLLLPIVRTDTEAFLAEMLLTLVALLALIGFARSSRQFGFWSGLTLLTKGSGIALALLPPTAILLSRRWGDIRQKWLWQSAAIVVAMAGPWYVFAPDALHQRVRVFGGHALKPFGRLEALPEFFWVSLGPALCALAVVGLVVFWRKYQQDRMWLALVAFLPGNILFRMTVAVWEPRHLVMITPGLVCLAALGFHSLTGRAPSGWPRRAAVSAMIALAVASSVMVQDPRTNLHGPAELADAVPANVVVLVSGSSPIEGAMIAELASRDAQRPGRIVHRGSKVLASRQPRGQSFRSFLDRPEDARAILEKLGAGAVAVDLSLPDSHTRLLYEYLRGTSEEWRLTNTFAGRIALYLRSR